MTKPILALILALAMVPASANAADLSADKVSEIIGVKATTTPDGVVRVAWPRKEVEATSTACP